MWWIRPRCRLRCIAFKASSTSSCFGLSFIESWSTLPQLCQNYLLLCVRIGKLSESRAILDAWIHSLDDQWWHIVSVLSQDWKSSCQAHRPLHTISSRIKIRLIWSLTQTTRFSKGQPNIFLRPKFGSSSRKEEDPIAVTIDRPIFVHRVLVRKLN